MLGFGFGFVEIGTLTPRPQPGNPRPRLFRLAQDRAVINRMGFNNGGFEAAKSRLAGRRRGIVGVNVGANKDSADRIADYVAGVREMAPLADYLTVNISSPNTPGLRALQDKGALRELLAAVGGARSDGVPVFLKVAPDLEAGEVDDVARAAIEAKMDALIVANTTVSRPPLRSKHSGEAGGLSGAPLKDLALQRLKDFRSATGGGMPLIAVGGMRTGRTPMPGFAPGRASSSSTRHWSTRGRGVARSIAGELSRCSRATASTGSPMRWGRETNPSPQRGEGRERGFCL
jgi:dihydroorotate dehydrogenase